MTRHEMTQNGMTRNIIIVPIVSANCHFAIIIAMSLCRRHVIVPSLCRPAIIVPSCHHRAILPWSPIIAITSCHGRQSLPSHLIIITFHILAHSFPYDQQQDEGC